MNSSSRTRCGITSTVSHRSAISTRSRNRAGSCGRRWRLSTRSRSAKRCSPKTRSRVISRSCGSDRREPLLARDARPPGDVVEQQHRLRLPDAGNRQESFEHDIAQFVRVSGPDEEHEIEIARRESDELDLRYLEQ